MPSPAMPAYLNTPVSTRGRSKPSGRVSRPKKNPTISHNNAMKEFGLTAADLEGLEYKERSCHGNTYRVYDRAAVEARAGAVSKVEPARIADQKATNNLAQVKKDIKALDKKKKGLNEQIEGLKVQIKELDVRKQELQARQKKLQAMLSNSGGAVEGKGDGGQKGEEGEDVDEPEDDNDDDDGDYAEESAKKKRKKTGGRSKKSKVEA
jgi:hypothetical protein